MTVLIYGSHPPGCSAIYECEEALEGRHPVSGILCYETPLLHNRDIPVLRAFRETDTPNLCNTETSSTKDPKHVTPYCEKLQKLIQVGAVAKLVPQALSLEQ